MSESKMMNYRGQEYFDDRLYVLYLCKGTVEIEPDSDGVIWTTIYHEQAPDNHLWCVVTYRNCAGYPMASVKHFTSREHAVAYMLHIEPETPLVSLNGSSPSPLPSYQDYVAWKKKNNLVEFDFTKVYTPGGTGAHELIGQSKEQFKGIDIMTLDALAQGIYEKVIKEPFRGTNLTKDVLFNNTREGKEEWASLAKSVAVKNGRSDGVRAIRISGGEANQEMLQDSPVMYDDKDTNRYLLPAYFISFYLILKSDIQYSSIYHDLEKYYSKIGETERSQKCYEEAVRFLPKGVDYQMLEKHIDV